MSTIYTLMTTKWNKPRSTFVFVATKFHLFRITTIFKCICRTYTQKSTIVSMNLPQWHRPKSTVHEKALDKRRTRWSIGHFVVGCLFATQDLWQCGQISVFRLEISALYHFHGNNCKLNSRCSMSMRNGFGSVFACDILFVSPPYLRVSTLWNETVEKCSAEKK